ncbi:hypothetical protein AB0M97_09335 [Streptomyces sp. NPDC051207]|uniref:hypothetical protein n=1 Tax=Streptomyces sp. NPDC051207 TaxID=3154641 RepID=UPI0034147F7F
MKNIRPAAGAAATVAAAALVLGGAGTASAQPASKPRQITSAQLQLHLTEAVEQERTAATSCVPSCAGQAV